jgi:hypothetical protein
MSMNKHVQLALCAAMWTATLAVAALAQGLPKGTEQNPGTVKAGNGKYIVLGCVRREGQESPATYVITDSRATPPAQYRLDGDPDLLRIHNGHTLEIGGPITPPSRAGGMLTLKAEAVTYISPKCVTFK